MPKTSNTSRGCKGSKGFRKKQSSIIPRKGTLGFQRAHNYTIIAGGKQTLASM